MPGFRGRGLLARFLYALPVSIVGHRDSTPPPLNPVLERTYAVEMTALLTGLAEWGGDLLLTLTPDARAVVVDYLDTVEARLALGGEYELVRDWGSKLVGASVRVAALLHVAEHAGAAYRIPIDKDLMTAGVQIGEYFSKHAHAVFGLMGADPALADAEALLRWIENKGLDHFTRREAHYAHRSRFNRADDLDAPLGLLEEAGWIRQRPDPNQRGRGRPASPTFDVNPVTHNAHKSLK
jgi:hypothetical protein